MRLTKLRAPLGWTGLGLLVAGIVILLFVTPVVVIRRTPAPQAAPAPVTATVPSTSAQRAATPSAPATNAPGATPTLPIPTTVPTVPSAAVPQSITICVSNLFQVVVGASKC